MSGHSKWSTIKHKKAALDAKRGKIFTKIVKEITIAAREGGGDANSNPRLRTLLDKARAVNMPQDNIQRAIKKGTGELPGQAYEGITYEGYGPGGIAVIIEMLTDNKNRAAAELRHVFTRHGSRLGEPGSVNWMFERLGVIRITNTGASEDTLMELLFEHPIHEIINEGETFMISMDQKALDKVRHTLEAAGYEVKATEIEWMPKTRATIDDSTEEGALAFLEALDELDDVQNCYSNL